MMTCCTVSNNSNYEYAQPRIDARYARLVIGVQRALDPVRRIKCRLFRLLAVLKGNEYHWLVELVGRACETLCGAGRWNSRFVSTRKWPI